MRLKDYIAEVIKSSPKPATVTIEVCVDIAHNHETKEVFIIVNNHGESQNKIKFSIIVE